MDNVTHTLVGLAVGELAYQRFGNPAQEKPSVRTAFLLVSAWANNLPDFDLLYTRILPGPLGYLLHHRGHTHTYLIAPLLAVPLVLLALALLRRQGSAIAGAERNALWVVGLLGGWVHLSLDYLNSYGVHPFWPMNGDWIYGDALFIVEPLIWFALAPALAFQMRTWVGRSFMALVVVTGVVLLWGSHLVELPMEIFATVSAGALTLLAWKLSSQRRVAVAAGMVLAGMLFCIVVSRAVKAKSALAFPDTNIHDMAASPRPADPTCWRVLVQTEKNGSIAVHRGQVEPFPRWLSAGHCGDDSGWKTLYEEREQYWKLLQGNNCWAKAFLRFARFPVIVSENETELKMIDARFEGRRNFAVMTVPKKAVDCPRYVPGWGFPMFLR